MGTNLIFSLECIQYSFSSKFSNILYHTNTLGIVRYTLKFYFIANTKAKENILANWQRYLHFKILTVGRAEYSQKILDAKLYG